MTIHYYSGVWVAGDGSKQTGFYFSTDGKSWSPAACSEKYVQVSEIFGSSGIYVAGISEGASYSIDGKTWYIVPFKDVPFIYNANGIWVAGTSSGLYYSPTWEVSTPPRTISEEWVLKSSVNMTSPVDLSYQSINVEFQSALQDYSKISFNVSG